MLTGILSRRNTASHRKISRLRALPLSPPHMWFSLLSQKIKKQENTFWASSCKKSLCMTSYDGIIRIRFKGRSLITSSQPATQAPLTLFFNPYTLYHAKLQGFIEKLSFLIICDLFKQIVKSASYRIVIVIRSRDLIPYMVASVCFHNLVI